MATTYTDAQFLELIPELLERLWALESRSATELSALVAEIGLSPDPVYGGSRAPWEGRYPKAAFAREPGGVDTFERRLRTAVTRRVGTPSGSDRAWNLGRWSAWAGANDRWVSLHLRPVYSVAELRAAAAAWLAGDEAGRWVIDHGFATEHALAEGQRLTTLAGSFVHERDGEIRSVSAYLDTAARVIGSQPKDDDERYDATLAHLREALGSPSDSAPVGGATVWEREGRRFSIKRMRTSRAISFQVL